MDNNSKCPVCGYTCNHFKLVKFDEYRYKHICIECYERQKHRKLTLLDVYQVPKNKQLTFKFNYHEK